MTEEPFTQADVDMARFLAETSFDRAQQPWKYHPMTLPTDELAAREYEHETERLRRFIRGQHITQGEAA